MNEKVPDRMNAPSLTDALIPARGSVLTAAAETDQGRAIAEVQAQMILAKKFPRDEVRALDRVLNSCMRKGLAEASQYCFVRAGTEISGPSIDLMTAIAAQWGNIMHGWRELTRHNGVSEIEAFAWDLETNTRVARTGTVKHIRDTKSGPKPVTEERDINELCANWGSRWQRTCLEKVIPSDIAADAVAQCDATLLSKAEVTPEKIKGMLATFEEFGVTKEMIEQRIQRRVDAITGPQAVQMGKIHKSLRDGMSKAGDWFDVSLGKKDVASATPAEIKPKASAKKKSDAPPRDPETGEIKEGAAQEQAAQQNQSAAQSTLAEPPSPAVKDIAQPQAQKPVNTSLNFE